MNTQNTYITVLPGIVDTSKPNITSVGSHDTSQQIAPDTYEITADVAQLVIANPTNFRWDGTSVVAITASKASIIASCLARLGMVSDQHQNSGIMFQAQGQSTPSLFSSATESRVNLTGAYALAKDGHWSDTPWTTSTGLVVLNAADVQTLAIGCGQYYSAIAQYSAQLVEAIYQATDPTSVDIMSGWPDNTVASTPVATS